MLLRKFGSCLRPDPLPKDQRRCCFCNQQGDGRTDGPARLLNLDLDLWVSPLGWTGFCWVLLGSAGLDPPMSAPPPPPVSNAQDV